MIVRLLSVGSKILHIALYFAKFDLICMYLQMSTTMQNAAARAMLMAKNPVNALIEHTHNKFCEDNKIPENKVVSLCNQDKKYVMDALNANNFVRRSKESAMRAKLKKKLAERNTK